MFVFILDAVFYFVAFFLVFECLFILFSFAPGFSIYRDTLGGVLYFIKLFLCYFILLFVICLCVIFFAV